MIQEREASMGRGSPEGYSWNLEAVGNILDPGEVGVSNNACDRRERGIVCDELHQSVKGAMLEVVDGADEFFKVLVDAAMVRGKPIRDLHKV